MLTREWNSIVGSTRTALYVGQGPGTVLIVSDEYSGGYQFASSRSSSRSTIRGGSARLPLYGAGRVAAKRRPERAATEQGERHAGSGPRCRRCSDRPGTLWSGDAPYGWTGSRGSVGLSLLGAYPTRSKRVYRHRLRFSPHSGRAGRWTVRDPVRQRRSDDPVLGGARATWLRPGPAPIRRRCSPGRPGSRPGQSPRRSSPRMSPSPTIAQAKR